MSRWAKSLTTLSSISEIAEHRNAADGLTLVGRDGDRMPTGQIFFTAPLSMRAQEHFGVGGAAEHQGRIGRVRRVA